MSAAQQLAQQLSLQFEDLQNVFYAKLVTKVGSKRYWELWAKDIAKIAEEHSERIKGLIEGEEGPYGLYVKVVNGIRADYDKDKVYWAFYINGDYAMSGVDVTEICAGDEYALRVEKG